MSASHQAPTASSRKVAWLKVIGIAFAAGPPIGGVVFSFVMATVRLLGGQPLDWLLVFPLAFFFAAYGYVFGLPVVALALPIFAALTRIVSSASVYLAAFSAWLSSALLFAAFSGFQLTSAWFVVQLEFVGIPSIVSALICWHLTKPLHRLL